MKQRTGFVSNSSSSSFVIYKQYLTPDQIDKIKRHTEMGKELGIMYSEPEDAWSIEESDKTISGDTVIDNFEMKKFLDIIGVDPHRVEWYG